MADFVLATCSSLSVGDGLAIAGAALMCGLIFHG
jgi:hypothetical protein